jgi:nicotinamidase-related amidase
MPTTALIVLDVINELTHADGHYSHVCLGQVSERQVIPQIALALDQARAAAVPVIYVVLEYAHGYSDWPEKSQLFGPPDPDQRLTVGRWGTQVHEGVKPQAGEVIIAKRRINPFHGTHLELLLRGLGVRTLVLVGVATDLVVLSAAREAHDLGYQVVVLEDGTATENADLQQAAVAVLQRTARVMTVAEAIADCQLASA